MNDKTEMPQEAARPKRKFGPSTVARLQVARVSEMGAFLDAQTGNTSDDILLHKTQQTHPVAVGDLVDVFLYLDPKRRLTASRDTLSGVRSISPLIASDVRLLETASRYLPREIRAMSMPADS